MGVIYSTLAWTRPADVFWSPDQGGKLLQVMALLEGRADLSISYPGRWLDPELAFRPYVFSWVAHGGIQLPWPAAWALASAPAYGLLGGSGLVVLPVLGGLLAAWAAGQLSEQIAPDTGWLAVAVVGLASPLLIYSTLFWEHAPAAGMFSAGLLLASGRNRAPGWRRSFLAGLCFGLATAWRYESAIYVVASALAYAAVARDAGRWSELAWQAAGLAIVLLPALGYNWLIGGAPLAPTEPFNPSVQRAVQNVVRYTLLLPADFLVGARLGGLDVPELLRWAPGGGLLVLAGALRVRQPRRKPMQIVGLLLAGAATLGIFFSAAPASVNGFLIAAPFLALILLAPSSLTTTQTGRFLTYFAMAVLPLYLGAALLMHVRGVFGGGAQWGPRYLLPLYPPLAVLATVALHRTVRHGPWAEAVVGRALVALGLLFQLAGLAAIDRHIEGARADGELVASLSPGLVVLRQRFVVHRAPGLTLGRDVFCTETPAALARWSELAQRAGLDTFWFVDDGPLPPGWLVSGAAPPLHLGEARAGELQATRYATGAVRQVLRLVGPERDTCGYRVNA